MNPFALFDTQPSFDDKTPCACLLTDLDSTITASTADELSCVWGVVQAAQQAGYFVALQLSYELGYLFEPHAHPSVMTDDAAPTFIAHVFKTQHVLSADARDMWLTEHINLLPSWFQQHSGFGISSSRCDAARYRQAIDVILSKIRAGEVYQVNYTLRHDLRWWGHPLVLYQMLRCRQPVKYGGIIYDGVNWLLSLSPELFLCKEGQRLIARPMKGTIQRGATPAHDHVLQHTLLSSEKDRAENIMIVDLLRNDLGRIARPGSVCVTELCTLETYPTLHQMTSQLEAQVPAGMRFDPILQALFPCGSITGAPKISAMRVIQQLEQGPRNEYTGALGWLTPRGDFQLNVAIRTLKLSADGQAEYGVGSGIVADSIAENEYEECQLKAQFIEAAALNFGLIETLLFDPQHCLRFPLLSRHLERLQRSAQYFGFRCCLDTIRQSLFQYMTTRPMVRHRVRLVLHRSGDVELSASELPLAQDLPLKVRLSELVWDDSNPLLAHKTTLRDGYDHYFQQATKYDDDIFDVLLFNAQDHLCEGTRSNVIIRQQGVYITPPLAGGILPGVMLTSLLADASYALSMRVISRADVLSAEEVLVCNAVRGLQVVSMTH